MTGADITDRDIADAIREQVRARGAGKSICPSEVARTLAPDWRALMPRVRHQAQLLSATGEIAVTQKGRPVHAELARGPIRLALPSDDRTPR